MRFSLSRQTENELQRLASGAPLPLLPLPCTAVHLPVFHPLSLPSSPLLHFPILPG